MSFATSAASSPGDDVAAFIFATESPGCVVTSSTRLSVLNARGAALPAGGDLAQQPADGQGGAEERRGLLGGERLDLSERAGGGRGRGQRVVRLRGEGRRAAPDRLGQRHLRRERIERRSRLE